MDELGLYIREALDRKQGNVRRQRRRDALRLQLVRIFQLIAERGTFGKSCSSTDRETQPLHPVVVEFVDGMRQCLELDTDRDSAAGREIRTCFASFVNSLIRCFPRKFQDIIPLQLSSLSIDLLHSGNSASFAETWFKTTVVFAVCRMERQIWTPLQFWPGRKSVWNGTYFCWGYGVGVVLWTLFLQGKPYGRFEQQNIFVARYSFVIKKRKGNFFTFYIFTLNSITLIKSVILIEKCRPCKTFTMLKFKLITKNCVHSRSTRWPRRRSSCCWNSILKWAHCWIGW